jgi:hypothetical protein
METMLKKPEIFRDSMGRFDRHGKTLSKTAKKTGLIKKRTKSIVRLMADTRMAALDLELGDRKDLRTRSAFN